MLSMNKTGETTLVTVFTENALSSFNMMLSLGLPFITFIMLLCIPLILGFFIALSWRDVEFCYRVFIYLDDDLIFVFFGFLCDILCVFICICGIIPPLLGWSEFYYGICCWICLKIVHWGSWGLCSTKP